MSKSPETMVYEWKKVTDPEIAAQAAVTLHKEGAEVKGAIYAIPSQDIGGKPAGDCLRQILPTVPNIETFDYIGSDHIDQFVEAVVGLAEDATIKRYGIKHFVEEEFTGTNRLETYCTRETLAEAGFTFDDKKGAATPPVTPAPLLPTRRL